jgi:hypothetical protein
LGFVIQPQPRGAFKPKLWRANRFQDVLAANRLRSDGMRKKYLIAESQTYRLVLAAALELRLPATAFNQILIMRPTFNECKREHPFLVYRAVLAAVRVLARRRASQLILI